jgi:hypothetical protein
VIENLYVNGYRLIKLIGEGWEGSSYLSINDKDDLRTIKIVPISDENINFCYNWNRCEIDLRKRSIFNSNPTFNEFEWASSELNLTANKALKRLKEQWEIHKQLQKRKVPLLIPAIEDFGVLLLTTDQSNCFRPATYQSSPYVAGETLEVILKDLNRVNLMTPFLFTGRVSSATINVQKAYERLSSTVTERLLSSIDTLFKHGIGIEGDIHPANIMVGSIEGDDNQIYLIDNRLCRIDNNYDKSEIVEEVVKLRDRICKWPKRGLLYSAIYNGIIEDEII